MTSTSLPYGMNKEYLDIVRPSGIVRTWVGVMTSNVRDGVVHELTLKVYHGNIKSMFSI